MQSFKRLDLTFVDSIQFEMRELFAKLSTDRPNGCFQK